MSAHKNGTMDFGDMDNSEQARALNAESMNFYAGILHRIENAPDRQRVKQLYVAHVERLLDRVKAN